MGNIPKVKSGLAEIAWAPITVDENGKDSYEAVEKFQYSREISSEPQGESGSLYLDSRDVMSVEDNDGYLIKLTMAKFDKVLDKWFGNNVSEDGKTRDEWTDQTRPRFVLFVRHLTTDAKGEVEMYINCQANRRMSRNGATREGKMAYFFEEAEIKAKPREDGFVMRLLETDTIPDTVPDVTKPTVQAGPTNVQTSSAGKAAAK